MFRSDTGFANGYDAAVQLDPASIKVVVGADSNLILQVISSLLSNAVKFFPSAGEVSSRSRISARWGAFRYAIRDRACPTITKPPSSKNSSRLTPPAPTAIHVDQRAGHGQTLTTVILLETGPIDRFADVGNFTSYARCVDSVHTSARRPGPTTSSLPRRWRTSWCAPAITF
jgi:Transposase IS116/IS110/IS902 family